jgi:hypothetical protein
VAPRRLRNVLVAPGARSCAAENQEDTKMRQVMTAILLGAAAGAPAQAAVLSYTGGSQVGTRGADATWGWAFETNTAITITDVYSNSVGAGSDDILRIYDASGRVLDQTTFTGLEPSTPGIGFEEAIQPLTLAAGAEYFITTDVGPGTQGRAGVSSVTTDPSITYLGTLFANGQGALPTTLTTIYSPGIFGPNFDVAVPEPGGVAMLGCGLLGLAGLARRRRSAP